MSTRVPINIEGYLMIWDGENPIYFSIPGSPNKIIPLFSSEEKLMEFYGNIEFEEVQCIMNQGEFLYSLDHGVDVIVDPREVDGKIKYLLLMNPFQSTE